MDGVGIKRHSESESPFLSHNLFTDLAGSGVASGPDRTAEQRHHKNYEQYCFVLYTTLLENFFFFFFKKISDCKK